MFLIKARNGTESHSMDKTSDLINANSFPLGILDYGLVQY